MIGSVNSVRTGLKVSHSAAVRRRNCTTKSRSGCITCKAKHLKCDEARPDCSVCREKGVPCGGYERKLRWSLKHQFDVHTDAIVRHKKRSSRSRAAERNNFESHPHIPNCGLSESGELQTSSPLLCGYTASSPDPIISLNLDTTFELQCNSLLDHFDDNLEIYQPENADLEGEQPWADPISTFSGPTACSTFELPVALPSFMITQGHGSSINNEGSTAESFQFSFTRDKVPRIPRTIVNLPSLLISRWFEQVCPIWSAFDSEISLNRTLAKRLWGESEAVLTSLQSMSAAYMANQAPQIKATTFQYMKAAMNAISSDISVLNGTQMMKTLPVGLLFALVCMGTIFGWINRHDLVKRLLRNTKAILSEARLHSQSFSSSDREMLSFFISSTQYWDTLVTFMGYEEELDGVASDDICKNSTLHIESMGCQHSLLTPHPWTGISTLTSQLFCETTKCCRLFRKMIRGQAESLDSLVDTLSVMERAEQLEVKLKQLEYPDLEDIGDTGDRLTPRQHLIEAAEAYRLSALLHLYQTFPSISTQVSPIGAFEIARDDAIWGDRVVPLALYLTNLLKKIPPDSGSRSLLPILYIAAGTGLRFQRSPSNQQLTLEAFQSNGFSLNQSAPHTPMGLVQANSATVLEGLDSVSEDTILVSDARHLIIQRLGLLEHCLYPKPIAIAKDLVKAIWEANDNDVFGQRDVHWVDIMEDLDLRSIFG